MWLKLFKAETEEELTNIEALEVPVMTAAVQAYRHVTASQEFREIAHLRSKARHDEAQALGNAKKQGAEEEREKWQSLVDEQAALIAELQAQLGNK